MTNEELHLDWHGPYAVIDGQSDPNLFKVKPLASASQGVYVWTIPVGSEFWVYYVGKAQDKNGLFARLRTEFLDKDPQKAHIDDAEKLLNGERVPLYKPLNSKGKPDVASWLANPDLFHRQLLALSPDRSGLYCTNSQCRQSHPFCRKSFNVANLGL